MPNTPKGKLSMYKFTVDFEFLLQKKNSNAHQLALDLGLSYKRLWTYTRDAKIKRYDRVKLGLMLNSLGAKIPAPYLLDTQPDPATRAIIRKLERLNVASTGKAILSGFEDKGSGWKVLLRRWVAQECNMHEKDTLILDIEAIRLWLLDIPYYRFAVDWSPLFEQNNLRLGPGKRKKGESGYLGFLVEAHPELSYEKIRFHLGLRIEDKGEPTAYDRLVLGSMLHALGVQNHRPFFLFEVEQ